MRRTVYAKIATVSVLGAVGCWHAFLRADPEARAERVDQPATPKSETRPRRPSVDRESDAPDLDPEEPESTEVADDAPGPAPSDGSTIEAEALRHERQSHLAVRDAFDQEQVDSNWAPQAEAFGRDIMRRIPGLSTATIECRSTLCEVRPTIPADTDGSLLLIKVLKDHETHKFFRKARNVGDLDDEPSRPSWYFFRAERQE